MTRLALVWLTTAIIVAVLLPSCTSTPPDLTPIPGQTNFLARVWNVQYQRNDEPPEVEWVRGEELNCADGRMFLNQDGACVGGSTIGDFVQIALPDEKPWWKALCHEVQHAWMYRQHLADPADHSRFDFDAVDKCANEMTRLEGQTR